MISFIYSAVRFSTVFLFGSTGETITEKSGHLNLGVPGIMCLGALGGCVGETIYMRSVADLSQMNGFSVIIMGIIFSMLFAGIGGLIYGFMTITLRCNQNVSGLALTTFGTGVANYFLAKLKTENYSVVSDYFSRATENISAKDGFSQLFLSYGALVYIAIFLAIIVSIIFKKTKTGLSLTAVGENPAAADAAGINVIKYKYVACVLGAAIAGLGGLFYVMDKSNGNLEFNIDALGWLAVALVIFSIWRPNLGILGSILFAALYIAPDQLNIQLNKDLIKMLPFVVTIIVLVLTSIINKKETQPPTALGLPYFREDR